MDIQTQKIAFVQEFLKLQSEEVISRLEKILRKEESTAATQEIEPMSIEEFNETLNEEIIDSGVVGEDTVTRLKESAEKWTQQAEELGYTDDGAVEDFDEWYDTETDFRPLAQEVFEEAFLEHRPN